MTRGPALVTRRLSKDYGSGRGLFELDLEVRSGEILGFLGPNGAGKSTTMRLLLGLIRPTSGSARMLGLDVARDGLAVRRRVGYLAGDFGLYPQLTGAAALRIWRGSRAAWRRPASRSSRIGSPPTSTGPCGSCRAATARSSA